MNINVFLLCYNEASILPHVIKHYKKNLPSCNITILDNESTDSSVEIAKSLGCNVISWSSNNIQDEHIQMRLKNTYWKDISTGWIIMADMDEFLGISEDELVQETNRGTTILSVTGIEMIGESKTLDLSDIDLEKINKYCDNSWESKHLCFLRENITEMDYGPGAHWCNPIGNIKYSSKVYLNKHMSNLGLSDIINKTIIRYERSELMIKQGLNIHYTNDIQTIENRYYQLLNHCKMLN